MKRNTNGKLLKFDTPVTKSKKPEIPALPADIQQIITNKIPTLPSAT